MRINSPYITGSAIITGNLCVQGTITGTITGIASTASYAETLDGLDSTQFVQTGSFNSYTSSASSSLGDLSGSVATTTNTLSSSVSSSIGSLSGSVATTTSNLSSSIGSLSGSVATTTSGLSSSIGSLSSSVATTTSGLGGRITTIEGRYATTGSNTFVGSQVITGSLYITTDLIVQGSSSLQNITASAVSIGTNTVILNTDTPAVRFAGISVQDSGSYAGVTGSIFWDGLCNRWVYSNPSGIGYSGGMLLSGPRTSTLGSESPLTCNYIAKSGGGDHLYDSAIYESGSNIGIGTTTINNKLEVAGNINIPSTNFFRYDGDTGLIGSATSINGGVSTQLGIRAANDILFATNGVTERMRISSTGIATFTCQICTVAAVTADLRYTGTGYITYDTSASGTSCLIFRQNGTEKMRISESGYVAVTGNEALSCVPYLQGMSFGWNRTNGQGESMINWTNAGGGTSCDLTFNFRDSSTLYERLRLTSTGIACFACSVIANGDFNIRNTSFSTTGTLNKITWTNLYPSTYNVADIGVQLDGNYYNGAIIFRTADADNANVLVERMRMESRGVTCFRNTVCAGAGMVANTLTISCNSGDDRAMYMSLNCSANYNSGAANTIARSVNSLKFLWYNNCWEIGATRGDDTAIQALVFARQGNTYLAMTCHGIANFTCQVCALGLSLTGASDAVLNMTAPNSTAYITFKNACNSNWGIGASFIGRTCNLDIYNFSTSINALTIGTTGVACFSNTVCSPRFVGTLSGYPVLATASCTLGGSSSDVTVYFTSNIIIDYGVNDYTVGAYDGGNAAVFSSLRALIPYNYYQSTPTTTVLASYIDGANGHSSLSVAICKLSNSNTYCIAVRLARSFGNVNGHNIVVNSNGIKSGF